MVDFCLFGVRSPGEKFDILGEPNWDLGTFLNFLIEFSGMGNVNQEKFSSCFPVNIAAFGMCYYIIRPWLEFSNSHAVESGLVAQTFLNAKGSVWQSLIVSRSVRQ